MIIGELKNKIDKIWETFWTGSISHEIPEVILGKLSELEQQVQQGIEALKEILV